MSIASDSQEQTASPIKKRQHPFRRAVLRGLGILMPPFLTIVLFIWGWTIIERYLLQHVEWAATRIYVLAHPDTLDDVPAELAPRQILREDDGDIVSFSFNRRVYTPKQGRWVGHLNEEYVRKNILTRRRVLPGFLCVFLLVLYVLGKFVAAPIGRILVNSWEALIGRLPLISSVYASVKQVTDFVFSEQEIAFNRVVAIQYPRHGIWSVAFVTGESLLDIRSAANEPVLSVLVPTSPMPMTGFTITIRKSEVVDLDITIDQAIQFIVSCGVVVPPQQQRKTASEVAVKISRAVAQYGGRNGDQRSERHASERTNVTESPDAPR